MMRRRVMPMRGRGLVGTVARTAGVAGTATVVAKGVSGSMNNNAQAKADAQAQEDAAQQAAFQSQQDVEQMKAQMAQMQAQQAAQALPATPAATAAAPTDDLLSQIERLSQLKEAGVLSYEEFVAAKAKLLS